MCSDAQGTPPRRTPEFLRHIDCLAEVRMIWTVVIGIVFAWLIIVCLQCLWPLAIWLLGVYFERKG
jgi:hypothetical protein